MLRTKVGLRVTNQWHRVRSYLSQAFNRIEAAAPTTYNHDPLALTCGNVGACRKQLGGARLICAQSRAGIRSNLDLPIDYLRFERVKRSRSRGILFEAVSNEI